MRNTGWWTNELVRAVERKRKRKIGMFADITNYKQVVVGNSYDDV